MSDLDKEIMISQRELKDVMAACYDRIIRLEKRIKDHHPYRSGCDPLDITPADVMATSILDFHLAVAMSKKDKGDGSS